MNANPIPTPVLAGSGSMGFRAARQIGRTQRCLSLSSGSPGKAIVGLERAAVKPKKRCYGGTTASLIACTAGEVGALALSSSKAPPVGVGPARLRSEAQLSTCEDPVVGSYFAFSL